MTAPVLDALHHVADPINPTTYGLYAAVGNWQPEGANRFLHGVEVRGQNYPVAHGVWATAWCAPPPLENPERKEGDRQDILDIFDPITVWAYDECDLTEPSRAEVEANAAQALRLTEQPDVEREFAERLKLDAADLGAAVTRPNIKEAVAYLEGQAAETGALAYFHVGAHWVAREMGLFIKSGTRWTSPLGNIWVVGGGYVDGLDDQIVATSQPYGWRNEAVTRTATDVRTNTYAAVAERSVSIGYEAVIAAVTVVPAP
jgi:hypothetical protein